MQASTSHQNPPRQRRAPAPAHAVAFTVTDACVMTGIGKTRLYELIAEGKLRAMKAGAKTLICAESVRAYLASLPTIPAKAA